MEGTRIALLINRSQGSYKQLLQPSINLLTWKSSPRTSYERKSPKNKLKSILWKLSSLLCNKPKFQPLDLKERDPFIGIWQGHESASLIVISFLQLIVHSSTWWMSLYDSSKVELWVASVTGERNGRFHDFPPCKTFTAICHFPPSTPCRRATCS